MQTEDQQRAEVFGGLTFAEWEHVAQVIMQWPRLGASDVLTSQYLVAAINERLTAILRAKEPNDD